MLAKILVWAPTREAAIPALGQALKDCEVGGIPTNLPFLHEALGLESFEEAYPSHQNPLMGSRFRASPSRS